MKELDIETITRGEFIRDLGDLLRKADLGVIGIRHCPAVPGDHDELVEVFFDSGGRRLVNIEADSRAAIIKDVLRRCE